MKKNMTPRQKQKMFREKLVSTIVSTIVPTIGCLFFAATPALMCLHWLVVGY